MSLIVLGQSSASDEYIDRLLDDVDWRNLNTGFHLKYYGDYPYEQPHDHLAWFGDLGGSFTRTAERLSARIRQVLDGQDYPLRDVEVFTLASLAQVRQSTGILDDLSRESIRIMLDRVIAAGLIKHTRLLKVLKVIREHLKKPRYAIGQVAAKLYQLKKQTRRGWLARGVQQPETVADHTLGAYLLGMIYLPETSAVWFSYDKATVLRMVMVHDLSEAFVGDALPVKRSEAMHALEQEVYDYFSGLTTYPGLYGMSEAAELATAFSEGVDFNARVARDLVHLDTLMQLWIYREQGQVVSDFEEFKAALMQSISSEPGQRILDHTGML